MLWEAVDGKDLMYKLAIKKPDVLLMDIRMSEIDGINAIEMIRKEYENIKIWSYMTMSALQIDLIITLHCNYCFTCKSYNGTYM